MVLVPVFTAFWRVDLNSGAKKSIKTFSAFLNLAFSSCWAKRVWNTSSKFTWPRLVISSHSQSFLNLAVLITCKRKSIWFSFRQLFILGPISYEQKGETGCYSFFFSGPSTVDKERKTSPKRESLWIDKRKTTTEEKVWIRKN